jgi:hypothetical protein
MEGKAFASTMTTSATQQEQRIVTQQLKKTAQVLTSDLPHSENQVSTSISLYNVIYMIYDFCALGYTSCFCLRY